MYGGGLPLNYYAMDRLGLEPRTPTCLVGLYLERSFKLADP